jgi:hypothetical protein
MNIKDILKYFLILLAVLFVLAVIHEAWFAVLKQFFGITPNWP